MIIIDTRQQANKHKHKETVWMQLGVQTVRSKLIVDDYARLDNLTVSVDTKKDIVEVAGNICGKQHERFRAECELARKCNIRLVVLVEEVPPAVTSPCGNRRKRGLESRFVTLKARFCKKQCRR